jgi:CRISPR/Cas system Type II protein with McrA/HNH and RuvC-like nuclease domain
MWAKQGGVCPQTGKIIPEEDINNHDLWHADHVIPYSKGGPTTVENGELVCKDYNLSKSNKMPEQILEEV